jgi:hypothetical protein
LTVLGSVALAVPLVVSMAARDAVVSSDPDPGLSHAPERGPDTTWGRIDGDLVVVGGLGASFGPRTPSGAVDARLRYLDTAGVFVTYTEGFGGGAQPARALAFGIEMRPLFLGRWLRGFEIGVAHLDLLIDSFGIEIGAALLQPIGGQFGDRAALQVGIGLEVPILPRASGPWIGLHGGARLSDIGLAHDANDALERSLYLTITLAWHQVVGAHVVDMR